MMSLKNKISMLLCCVFLPTSVFADQEKPYGPIVDLNGRIGSERNIGRVEFNIPLAQTKDQVVFADLRGIVTDNDEQEGNVGVGYRQVIDLNGEDYIAGGYGFFDYRRTEFDNKFSQITVGGEILGEQWRARANYYQPLSDNAVIQDDPDTATLTTDGFVIVDRGLTIEEPLTGLDLEVGYKLPVFEKKETWAHLGVYKFGIPEGVVLNGIRFRGETQINDWLRLGVESSYDNVRKDNHFFDVRVRIPLQKTKTPSNKFASSIHRYMQEPIVRDVDIVTSGAKKVAAAAAKGPKGKAEKYIFVDNSVGAGGDGTPGNPYNNLAEAQNDINAGNNDKTIFIRQGDGTVTNMNTGINITQKDARLIGSGVNLTTRDGVLVESATVKPRLTNVGGDAVSLSADNIEVAGLYIDTPSADGIFSFNVNNSNLRNNEIVNAGNNGINAAYTDNKNYNVSIENNVTTGSTLRGITVRSFNGADVTATVQQNISNNNTQEGLKYEVGATSSTLDLTSTNNIANANGGVAGLYAVTSGNGALTLNSNNDTANNNSIAHGIFFLLGGTDTHNVTLQNGTANNNGDIGIGLDVQDSTTVTASLLNNSSSSNGGDGLNVTSRSSTNLNATITNHTSAGDLEQGVDIVADGVSSILTTTISGLDVTGANSSGVSLNARSGGTLNANLSSSIIDSNTGSGLFLGAANTANSSIAVNSTTVTNSSSFNINLSDTTSGTYNIDLGGGALGSLGQNRIFTSGSEDVFGNLNGSNVSAQSNWWGVPTGLAPGETNLVSGGSIDASSPLTSDPGP